MEEPSLPRPAIKASDYPEIPAGSSLNYNPKTGTFQVYQYGYNAKGERIKISIGSIDRNRRFSFSDLFTARRRNAQLERLVAKLKELLKTKGVDNVDIAEEEMDKSGAPIAKANSTEAAGILPKQQNENESAKQEQKQKNENESAKQEVEKGKETENQKASQAEVVKETIGEACDRTAIDTRKQSRVVFPMEELCLIAIMSALSGRSDAYSMSQYYTTHKEWLDAHLLSPGMPESISHDTFRTHLLLLDPKRFEEFYSELLGKFVIDNNEKIRVIAFDGQAIRATARIGKDGQKHGVKYFMNVFDTGALLCLCHKLIPKKKNEISVGFQMLDGLDVRGAVITADALNTQTCFVNSILNAGADYCLAVKDNHESMSNELEALFNTTHPDHVKTHTFECECEHGRVEQRTVKVIPRRFLSRELKDKWRGLAEGSVVMVTCDRTNKRSRKTSLESRYYISSLSNRDPSVFGEIVRRHWFIENKMHWMLDCNYMQDRINGSSENYLCNRSSLNNLSLGILYR